MKKKSIVSKISLIAISVLIAVSCNTESNNKSNSQNETPMSTIEPEQHVILINSFEVPVGKLEESIEYWEACRDFLKKEPGYISTKLHQSIKDDARFELVNVAVWKTPEAFMSASKKMGQELDVPPTEGLKANPSLYTIIRE